MGLSLIIMIILIILLVDKNSECKKLLEENRKLKEQLKQNHELTEKIEISKDQSVKNAVNHNQQASEQVLKETKEQKTLSQQIKEKPKNNIKNEKEQKNVTILVTGAICIVLSAIVFLMSTWNTIPNILKTVVLSLLTLVFFGGSYIAKEKFKLEKTSQTFFYIAMAYIPICMISISIFKLFGTYLSIYGEGKYIYLTFSSLLVAMIYYITYMNKNNKYLLYGSLLSQTFSVIAFSLILSSDIIIIGINLLLYNILLILITKKDIFKKIYNFIPAIITFVAITMLGKSNKMMIIMLILLSINFLILELKNSNKIYSYMFNICLMVFGLYTIDMLCDILETNISHLLVLCFAVLVYICENVLISEKQRENLQNSLTVVTLSTIGILHIDSFSNTSIVAPYVISILQMILLIITYIKSKSVGKDITAILIPIYFISTGISFINELNCSYHIYIMFAFLTFAVSEIFRKKDKLIHLRAFIISHILIALTYIVVIITNYNNFIDDTFYAVLLTGVYFYSYLVNKNMIFKYLSYSTLNFVLFTLFKLLVSKSEILYLVPMIHTLIIMGVELIYKEIQDEKSDIYLAISEIISFVFIYGTILNEVYTILAIIFAIIIILDNIKHKDKVWNILPLTCVCPVIFLNNLSTELSLGIMLLSTIAITGCSLREKKISIFTVFSGIYLFFTSFHIESIYLKEILFICWSVIHLFFMEIEKERDMLKFLSYLSALFLYNSIIADLELETYTLFSMLGYVIMAIFTLRTILIKHVDNIDEWEYIVFGLIYLFALSQYNNELDGMLFGLLLVTIVIASYIKKYGALFMVSIFAILVNIFALTREFWFSVPWWVYLLGVGTILIIFAIRNEISDKKSEINAIDILKNIKDRVDK